MKHIDKTVSVWNAELEAAKRRVKDTLLSSLTKGIESMNLDLHMSTIQF
jgi:hypothetical protein